MEDQLPLSDIRITVPPAALPLFTTVLQSGIEVKVPHGKTLGKFLDTFPGFTAEYLADTVQTIFLNGTAVDDLTLPLTGSNPVLALSAAMPGLAGAIFRKNSFHSALRTETNALGSDSVQQESITVTLKLFNSIARERGEEMLKSGLCIKADLLAGFLTKRPNLLQQILNIHFGKDEMDQGEFLRILPALSRVNLYVVGTND
jgi:hypothetical protein